MATVQSWEVSDDLWSKVEPLVPACDPRLGKRRRYRRQPGGGRKRMGSRNIFAAIVYVLRTGCQWRALPKVFGSASAIHTHFQRWREQGFFVRLWRAGLAEYDEMEGIAWEWQSLDGTQGKAPLAQEAVGMREPGLRAEDLHRVGARRPAQGTADRAAADPAGPGRRR